MGTFLRVLVTLAGCAALSLAAIYLAQRRLVFPRHMTRPLPRAGDGVPGLERLFIESPEGKIEAFFVPGNGVSESLPGPVVIFAHGNAELIEYWPEALDGYRRMGVSVLLPEYRGYGRSAGSPSEQAIVNDFTRFHDLIAARPDVDSSRIVLHGRSIGGGVACSLAARRRPAALVLTSSFTSMADMAWRFHVPAVLLKDRFDNLLAVSGLDVPVLVAHGRGDDLIPYEHGVRLAAAAKRGRLVTWECGHNDCPPDRAEFWHDLEVFLRDAAVLKGRR